MGFNWFGLEGLLTTTDTFYPHLFIELGLVTSLVYLFFVISPLFFYKKVDRKKFTLVLIIYTVLLLDSIATFSLNNITYLLISLTLIFPILYGPKKEDIIRS